MTEYVVLIVGDAEYTHFGEELARRGHKVTGGAELHQSSEARSIRPGSSVVTDGPFTETAEQVGGFYLLETDDLEVRRTVDASERPS